MNAVPAWVAGYIGIPFADKGRTRAGCDCWGGVRLALAEQFGIALPDYCDAYRNAHDHDSVSAAVRAGLRDGWSMVDGAPQCGDLLVIKIAGRPWHCGLMVSPTRFLHWPTQPDRRTGKETGTSCIERLDALIWRRRIEGIYRHASMHDAEAA